jgi:carbon-monoxide dehydrogenase medium subunit
LKAPDFDYEAPATLEEALALLKARGDDAKVLAGGQSLMPMLNMRLARPALVVDINRLPGLDAIRVADGRLRIGALVRHTAVVNSPEVAAGWTLLREAAAQIGHDAIRNRGTVAGSMAHADPSAEHPAVLAALDGELVLRSARGERTLTADQFFLGYLTTALQPDELVTEVRFPRLAARTGSAFVEFAPRLGDFALVGVAAAVTLAADGAWQDVRLALTGVGGTPFRARQAEAALRGSRPRPDDLKAAAAQVAQAIEPEGDIKASARYRRHLARVLTERALALAAERAAAQGGR